MHDQRTEGENFLFYLCGVVLLPLSLLIVIVGLITIADIGIDHATNLWFLYISAITIVVSLLCIQGINYRVRQRLVEQAKQREREEREERERREQEEAIRRRNIQLATEQAERNKRLAALLAAETERKAREKSYPSAVQQLKEMRCQYPGCTTKAKIPTFEEYCRNFPSNPNSWTSKYTGAELMRCAKCNKWFCDAHRPKTWLCANCEILFEKEKKQENIQRAIRIQEAVLGRSLTDAEKAAAQWRREEQMSHGQVSMPPGWHPQYYPGTQIPVGDIMMHGGKHFRPGHPPTLGDGGRPIKPPFLPPGSY